MMHKPIYIKNLNLSFTHKTCFDDFSTEIQYGSRIAIIGRNGSGKSTVLKLLQGFIEPSNGDIFIPQDVNFGYVPQIIEEFATQSGGERLNAALTKALSHAPNALLLDEPTNHLDCHNRKSLQRCLNSFPGTLIIVSHDIEILRHCTDTLWHIEQAKITIFTGNYDNYLREQSRKRMALEQALFSLERQKKAMHQALMQEQQRAAKSRAKGEKNIQQRKWPTIVSHAKARRGEETFGQKKSAINDKKQDLLEQISNLRLPEVIVPKFNLTNADIGNRTLLSIYAGSVGFQSEKAIIRNINLSLNSTNRTAILGNNGSGKSTLVKAILHDDAIIKTGDWDVPKKQDIGYLDQHYSTLFPEKTVLESIAEIVPTWSHIEVRRHLSDFLFHKNEEVNAKINQLSGGEKARLSLAQIAAKTPRLLILDEITNNLDLETREHVINVLSNYPGAMIIICHDTDFLNKIGISNYYEIINNNISMIFN